MLIAQLTDTHIKPPGELAYGAVDTATALERAINALNALRPKVDAVFLTGDLTDRGTAEEYEHLRSLLQMLQAPWYLAMGNHDCRVTLRAAFWDDPNLRTEEKFVHYKVTLGNWDVIVLDTTVPGKPHGELCRARLDWLDAILRADPDRPALIFQHHPPFDTGIGHMDVQRLKSGAEEELELLAQHKRVRHLACGHVHRAVIAIRRGICISIAPAPAHSVTLDLTAHGDETFTIEPAQTRLFRLTEAGDLTAHLAPVAYYGAPQPFRDQDGRLL